ncbi:MAG TPA: TOMM system kinase/cyclase fusion protein, partial [Cytophagales bacterium]|nr:TOMM system kinase/cyclase fusion protein [Cytophagales bacterium]
TYSAPEQLRGESPTPKSDLYAWGLILLECLTSVPVMDGQSMGQVFQKQLAPTPVPLPPVLLDHPLGLLMRRVLEKNPRNRIQHAKSLLKEFESINFQTLTGSLQTTLTSRISAEEEATVDNVMGWQAAVATRKQITVLCLQLQLQVVGDTPIELEVLDALQKDQLQLCKDTTQRYGGTVSEPFMNHLAVYFGYPESYDTDARRAGKAALELKREVAERSAQLEQQHGLKVHLRIGLHSGTALVQTDQLPQGSVSMIAFELAQQAREQVICVSESTQRLLAPFSELVLNGTYTSFQASQPITTYHLEKERESETGTALRPWSADRPMVGRDQELAQALNIWENAKTGGQALILHGQAGIGKSKLTHEIKETVRSQGGIVRECRCLPEHQNNALYPFLNMLTNHWGLSSSDPNAATLNLLETALVPYEVPQEIAVPLLASWLNLSVPDTQYPPLTQSPDEQKGLLFEYLETILTELGGDKPYLLVLEDLHWLDPTSTEFTTKLLNGLGTKQFMILMTTRPNFENPWVTDLYQQIELDALPGAAVRSLVEASLEKQTIEDAALAYIQDRTDGIPLFVEELTSMLKESGYLVKKKYNYQLIENIQEQAVPSTLADLLNARLDRLAQAKETAQLASAIGREFDYELLIKASGKPEENILQDLDQLTKADLVYRQRKGQQDSYIFRHALIRDAAYDGMVNAHRESIHASIARTIEANFPDMLENTPMEPARHFAGAGNHERAVDLGNHAVQKQAETSGNQEAIALSKQVRGWIKSQPETQKRYTQELQLNGHIIPAQSSLSGYGSQEVAQIKEQNTMLLEHAKNQGFEIAKNFEEETVFKTKWIEFVGHHFSGRRQQAHRVSEEILNSQTVLSNRKKELGVLIMIGESRFAEGRLADAEAMWERILALYIDEEDGDVKNEFSMDPKGIALILLSNIYLYRKEIDRAKAYVDKAIAFASAMNHQDTIILAYIFKAQIAYFTGDKALQKALYKACKEQFGQDDSIIWATKHLEMYQAWATADVAYAKQYIHDILEEGQDYALSKYEPSLAETYIAQGAHESAIQLLTDCLERITSRGERWSTPWIKALLAQALYRLNPADNRNKALELLRESKEECHELGYPLFEDKAMEIEQELTA